MLADEALRATAIRLQARVNELLTALRRLVAERDHYRAHADAMALCLEMMSEQYPEAGKAAEDYRSTTKVLRDEQANG